MTVRTLHLLGSPVLRQKAKVVAQVDDAVRTLVDDLFETMRAARGVGLAANQIGVARRVAVVDVGEDAPPPLVLINPVIVERGDEVETAEEGCLSIPEIFGDVERRAHVVVEAIDRDGRPYRAAADGYKARAIQHEIDHLDGILFLDHLSAVKRGLLLANLVGEGFDVVAVVTQPDAPQGRSRSHLVPPPVKLAAQAEDLTVFQPERLRDTAFLAQLRDARPDIGVVVAYGHILKPELLALPPRGMVNVHPSLLPELRGAAPVEWAIINGLEQTGVTIMQLDAGMDSGPILHQIPHAIDPDVTGGELSEHLAEMGTLALVETLALLEQGALTPVPQDHSRATYAPKLTREIARIDWTKDAATIALLIRGLDPRPGAWTELDGTEVKLFGARTAEGRGQAGELLTADGRLLIAAGGGVVDVEEVQPAGKARMPAGDWLRGAKLPPRRRFV